jgi:hypothetical protein
VASAVDICNLALSRLGDDATVSSIDPPEGSAQAEHCKRFYPIARDVALSKLMWNFATKRAALALLSNVTTAEWQYAYSAPSDILSSSAAVNVYPDGSFLDGGVEFAIETTTANGVVIYTNVENAYIRYTSKVTDTTRFTVEFVDALAYLLASYLAGPVLKGEMGMKIGLDMLKMFKLAMAEAAAADANGSKPKINHVPDFVSARGFNSTIQDGWIQR